MGFASKVTGRKPSDESDDVQSQRNEAFRLRTSQQQFLRNNAALVSVLARKDYSTADLRDPKGIFVEKAIEARHLAVAIFARLSNTPENEVDLQQARAFRQEAQELVAQSWAEGVEIDVASMADQIVAGIRQADDGYDADDISFKHMSPDAIRILTTARAAMQLHRSAALYDFRKGVLEVVRQCSEAITDATNSAIDKALTPMSSLEDRRSLAQSFTRSFSELMVSFYEDAARSTVDALVDLNEDERRRILMQEQPFETMLAHFRMWADEIALLAIASAKEMVKPTNANASAPSVK